MFLALSAGHKPPPHGVTIALGEPLPYHARPHRRHAAPIGSQRAERIVALTIWGEARGHGDVAMRAIASVIMNRTRADDARFGDGPMGVVWHRRQFSCWNRLDPNRKAMRSIASLPHDSRDYARWISAKTIARAALGGHLRDRTGGATFYHAGTAKPAWHARMRLTRTAWGHSFFRPTPERA